MLAIIDSDSTKNKKVILYIYIYIYIQVWIIRASCFVEFLLRWKEKMEKERRL